MEGVTLDHFNKLKPSTIPMAQFHSQLSDESDHDARTTATNLLILIQFIITKNDSSILDNHMGSYGWLRKSVLL